MTMKPTRTEPTTKNAKMMSPPVTPPPRSPVAVAGRSSGKKRIPSRSCDDLDRSGGEPLAGCRINRHHGSVVSRDIHADADLEQ